jgi:hypothetical protein
MLGAAALPSIPDRAARPRLRCDAKHDTISRSRDGRGGGWPVVTSIEDLSGTFWFCLDHHTVEGFAGCGSRNRIGPFPSQEQAAQALQTVADREQRYEAADREWDGDD